MYTFRSVCIISLPGVNLFLRKKQSDICTNYTQPAKLKLVRFELYFLLVENLGTTATVFEDFVLVDILRMWYIGHRFLHRINKYLQEHKCRKPMFYSTYITEIRNMTIKLPGGLKR